MLSNGATQLAQVWPVITLDCCTLRDHRLHRRWMAARASSMFDVMLYKGFLFCSVLAQAAAVKPPASASPARMARGPQGDAYMLTGTKSDCCLVHCCAALPPSGVRLIHLPPTPLARRSCLLRAMHSRATTIAATPSTTDADSSTCTPQRTARV